MNFLRGTKAPPPLPSPAVIPESKKAIITCEACGTDCRVPADRGTIRVTCPGCRCQGLWSPPETQAKPARPGTGSEYPEEIRVTHSCKVRDGVAVMTFKRFRPLGQGSYRLYRVETMPRGSGRAAIDQARDQSDDLDTFPDTLIDWSDVACPHCHAPAARTVVCGTCRTLACLSSVTVRKDREYFRCLCGAEGPLNIVDVVNLTQTKAGYMRENVAPADPPAQTDAPRLGYQGHGPARLSAR